MLPLERKSLLPDWHQFGLDSVQGYLELPEWYGKRRVIFACDPADSSNFDSMYFYLLQLEKDGFLITEWAPKETSDGKELLTLKQISLTTSGKKLLSELKAKSRTEKLKNRLITLVWTIITSVLTTLAVLAVKGG